MGLFGHMRIIEGGIDRSLDTPITCTSTIPSSTHTLRSNTPTNTSSITLGTSCTSAMPISTHTPSPGASTITSSTTVPISENNTGIADFSCPHCLAHSPHASAWSVTCESIAHRLANQCLGQQHTSGTSASTALTTPSHSPTAWAY
ncbi:hypothetical protein SprV_0100347200 [Sparganum proliferum]